jgi:hypothetical protein
VLIELIASSSSRLDGTTASRSASQDSFQSTTCGDDAANATEDNNTESPLARRMRAGSQLLLHVHLWRGYDLAVRDSGGTSDPYVKFSLKGKLVHKSKTVYKDLNPVWDEQFVVPVEDPYLPLQIKVGSPELASDHFEARTTPPDV